MNSQIKERWVRALRSGQYEQTKGILHNNQGYCCLGVLCDLYAKEHDVEWQEPHEDNSFYTMNGCGSTLPDVVVEWADVEDTSPDVTFKGRVISLANLNDSGKTFDQIAQVIEENF